MSNVPSDTPLSPRRKPKRTSIPVAAIAKAVSRAIGLPAEEQAFELPRGFSNSCHLPFIFATEMV